MGAYEFECRVDDDCYDADICTHDQCGGAGMCVFPPEPNPYGDVDHNGWVNVLDAICVLAAIEGDFTDCTFESCDVHPCATDCDGDGMLEDGNCVLSVFDTFAVLDAILDIDPCCSEQPLGGMGAETAGFAGAGTAELTLEMREVSAQGLVTYEVDVYASEFVDLRAYEVGLDVHGAFHVQTVYVDITRPDYVFTGLESYSGLDTVGGRIVTVSIDGGVASAGRVYLGTFVLHASEEARGTFQVRPRPEDGTILLDSLGQRLTVLSEPEAKVSLP